MKKCLFLLVIGLSVTTSFAFDAAQTNFFEEVNSFLSKYVSQGKVDYQSIKNNSSELDKLIGQIKTINLSSLSEKTKKAFYINAYNILVIKSVVENYPIKGPLTVPGFFDKKQHVIAGERMTLNDIENKKLRAAYNDSRIHFVLVCAAKGCPQIVPFVYTPEKLQDQLMTQTKKALNDDAFVRVKPNEKKVLISEIFKWYKEDFPDAIIEYLNKYRSQKILTDYTVDYYPYNWDLNDK